MRQDEVIKIALKAGKGDDDWIILLKQLFKHFPEEFKEFVNLLAEHERQACAKYCEKQYEFYGHDHVFAAGIKKRGQE